jgi:sterol desaturase/sphingolipid hydroxylase (fatty acid hydroxylase superfamily)
MHSRFISFCSNFFTFRFSSPVLRDILLTSSERSEPEIQRHMGCAIIAVKMFVVEMMEIVALAWIVDCAVGAWLGHDGFQWPGSGDYFHHLHHKHFDCNYGASHVPSDLWFGTFAGCKEDIAKNWRGKAESKKVGAEGNETGVHSASKTEHVE